MSPDRLDGDGNRSAPAGVTRRFLLDAMLGRLATYLRMCGYNTAYALDRGVEADPELRDLASVEGRTLLTRDTTLAAATDGAILLTSTDIDAQLRELQAAGVDLTLAERPLYCGDCNGRLVRCPGDPPIHAPDDRQTWRCRECGQHFWKGSHWTRVGERLANLRSSEPD